MNFQQLETFQWIARLESFSLAARKLHSTQSTVSTRLADLERELGITLFDRSKRSIKLTAKGRDLLRYVDEVLMLTSEIRQYVGNPDFISGTARIGAAELVALTWLPRMVKTVQKQYPLVELELHTGLGGNLLKRLDDGRLDIVLMPVSTLPIPGMQTLALGEVQFDFVASPSLGLSRRSCSPAKLSGFHVISHGQSSVLHEIQVAWFERGGRILEKFTTSSSMEAAARLAEAGLGVTLLPLFYYERAFRKKALVRIPSTPSIKPVRFVAISRQTKAPPLVNALAQIAADCSSFQ